MTDALQTLPELIDVHARFRGAEPALIEQDRTLTWRELGVRVEQLAAGLAARGVGRGERVAFVAVGAIWAYEALLAIARAGAGAVPISPLLTPHAAARVLESSRARLVIADEAGRALAEAAAGLAAAPVAVISLETLAAALAADLAWPSPDDAFNLIYSSGSTGAPKPIVHSHRTRVAMGLHVAAAAGFTPQSRSLIAIPPHSNGAFIFLLPALLLGATVVLTRRFEPDAFFDAVRCWRPTHVFVVPTMIRALALHPRRGELATSSLQVALSGGAPIPAALRPAAEAMFDGRLAELWGLTEGLATYLPPAEAPHHRGSVGRPLAAVDLRILGPDGRERADGDGEIVGRSSFMMTPPDDPAAWDAATWIAPDGTRFIRTGDVGVIDADGHLHIRGRLKEMLISGGLNVYFVDLEAALLAHPDVADAAVAAMPHEKWGEAPAAYVKLPAGSALSGPVLMDWANARLAKHQRLAALTVLGDGVEIPRNALGKVVRRELASLTPAEVGP